MDEFYQELAMQVQQINARQKENEKYLFRILDAKQAIKAGEPIADPDMALIDNVLDDTLKLNALITDYFDQYEKFQHMYTQPWKTTKQ